MHPGQGELHLNAGVVPAGHAVITFKSSAAPQQLQLRPHQAPQARRSRPYTILAHDNEEPTLFWHSYNLAGNAEPVILNGRGAAQPAAERTDLRRPCAPTDSSLRSMPLVSGKVRMTRPDTTPRATAYQMNVLVEPRLAK
jgi:hypothetical protein